MTDRSSAPGRHARSGVLASETCFSPPEIAEARRLGYAIALDKMAPGIGGVSVLLPRLGGLAAMAVSISTLSTVVESAHAAFFTTIRDSVRRHLGSELPPLSGHV